MDQRRFKRSSKGYKCKRNTMFEYRLPVAISNAVNLFKLTKSEIRKTGKPTLILTGSNGRQM